ncbi:2OG-Fe(II) oxygenase [Chitinimonas sp.]|uniref:prolyl hydroxylase family protein n=1 Tax=Chitinimonas sp. TaxID=1934313 RepID=UPI002F955C76
MPLLQEAYQTRIALPMECSAVRYGPGGHFQVHVDNGEGLEHRAFSVVCYLNDGLTGGETHFPDLELAVRPSAGLAIAFPSGYRHAALPVMAGMKYVLVCWLAGAPAVKWI